MAEMKGFIFAVTFLIVFTGLIASMPTALFGLGETPTTIGNIDPNLISDFADSVHYSVSNYTPYTVSYSLGDYNWISGTDNETYVTVSRKIMTWIFWFGGVDNCEFVLSNGTNRGDKLYFSDIQGDATDGVVRYNLRFTSSSNDAGGFVCYWNSTKYPDPADAWADSGTDGLAFLHGVGVTTPNTNIIALLLGLLTFQIPSIPAVPNLIIVTPIAVSVIFLIWFIIKESLPFW